MGYSVLVHVYGRGDPFERQFRAMVAGTVGAVPDQMPERCSAPIRSPTCLAPLHPSGSDNMGRVV